MSLVCGIYEKLVDAELQDLLSENPDLQRSLRKIEDEAAPHLYSQFLWQLLRQALPNLSAEKQFRLVNRLIDLLAAEDGLDYTQRKKLLHPPSQLMEATHLNHARLPRPSTPLNVSSLLTGAYQDPSLDRELRNEMFTADRVDLLVSFIKNAGLSLLKPAFENLVSRGIPVRIITTSYMGASDPKAIEWLSQQPGFSVKVSYDTERTRLHAKAYHFHRNSGFSTAYIGSANMSQAAMTSGLEWTMKVTAQDMPHILERFCAEFEGYWASTEFEGFGESQFTRFRQAIQHAKHRDLDSPTRFFVDIRPHPFQERILESLLAEREAGRYRNLVVAATGTGKTVISAFDYARFRQQHTHSAKLLYVAHRKEILLQARECFRLVLRDMNFGELLVDGEKPESWEAVFASIQSLNSSQIFDILSSSHFDYIIVDEAHHGQAVSYRKLFKHFIPKILLGLTATPERMDGLSLLPDFDHRFAAEIRLPEALEEKLLCPFHYFGISDPIALSDESFWRHGQYDHDALTKVYTGDSIRAHQRLDIIIKSLHEYHPYEERTRGVGFCVGVDHANYMTKKFREAGFKADSILGNTSSQDRADRIQAFRKGTLNFLFTVDVFSEGVDIPEINLVMFLRPTQSMTVFLQQLGRGLRHAPEKDCLTVLDFVGQCHRKYRVDLKFAALLRQSRSMISSEIANDFPNLPVGCSIQLERVAKDHILENIKANLGNLNHFIPESIRTFEVETGKALTFTNFIQETQIDPLELLRKRSWSEWKCLARGNNPPDDAELEQGIKALRRIVLRTDPNRLEQLRTLAQSSVQEHATSYKFSERESTVLHYLLRGNSGPKTGVSSVGDSLDRWRRNRTLNQDLLEILDWRLDNHPYPTPEFHTQHGTILHLHAAYGLAEITASFGLATFDRSGPTGTGMIPIHNSKTYILLLTFKKEERDFAPSTLYKDYLISRQLLHTESQSGTTQASSTGQNFIHFKKRGYQLLFFARETKNTGMETSPFIFLGAAKELISYEGDRPISLTWELEHSVPAEFYERCRVI